MSNTISGRRCCFGIASWTRTDQDNLTHQLRLEKGNGLADEPSHGKSKYVDRRIT